MRKIALFNQKGGVGKTTTTVNLGAALAAAGKRVVLVDMDPQANLSFHLGLDQTKVSLNTYQVLCEGVSLAAACVEVAPNLLVAPATTDLAGAEVELVEAAQRELRLKTAAEAALFVADYVLIDCPPSLGLLTLNSLCFADEVIIPLQAHFLALQGMARLLETCQLVQQRLNPRLRISGVLFCQYEAAPRLSGEVAEEVETFFAAAREQDVPWNRTRVFDTQIRRNIKLAEAPSFGQSIFLYAPSSAGCADYAVLAEEVMKMTEASDVGERPGLAENQEPVVEQAITVTIGETPAASFETQPQ
ncbi:MAG: ParA family protein [Phycisphaerales bacterium]|nr:ParA family protein [Phycisphaerales bacterium]